jgi:PTH1 family peptidyl-tRNA hydrolase
MTFMNLSGRAAVEAARKLKIPVERMLVIHDDVELPFGEVRVKDGQGLEGTTSSSLNNDGRGDFWRLRVGVGRRKVRSSRSSLWVAPSVSRAKM